MIEAMVSAYTLDAREGIGRVISVDRANADGTSWAVRCDGMCLRVGGGWDYEPQPSSRTDEFLAEHRYATAEQGIAAARKAIAAWARELEQLRATR